MSTAVIGVNNSACNGYMLADHNCHLQVFEYSAPAQFGLTPGTLGPLLDINSGNEDLGHRSGTRARRTAIVAGSFFDVDDISPVAWLAMIALSFATQKHSETDNGLEPAAVK